MLAPATASLAAHLLLGEPPPAVHSPNARMTRSRTDPLEAPEAFRRNERKAPVPKYKNPYRDQGIGAPPGIDL
jgi:hypothetical protein